MSRANLSPRKRERILATYAPVVVEEVARQPSRNPTPAGSETLAGARSSTSEALAYRCPGCTYTYDVAAGDEHEGFAAGTGWHEIPDDWCCPDCGVRDKVDFVPLTEARA